MLFFAKARYNTGKGNRTKWEEDGTLTYEEKMIKADWGYMPGLCPKRGGAESAQYREILTKSGVPSDQIDRILSVLDEVLDILDGKAEFTTQEISDMTECDLRPWTEFPMQPS